MRRPHVRFVGRFLLCGTLVAAMAAAYVSSTPIAAKEQRAPALDLTQDVKVTLSESLLGFNSGKYFVMVSIRNPAETALEGPVDFIIENTGIDTLLAKDATGQRKTGESYFRLVEEGATLAADKATKPLKIEFTSSSRLTAGQKDEFKLAYRIERPAVEKTEVKAEPKVNPSRLDLPSGSSSSQGNKSQGTAGKDNKSQQPAKADAEEKLQPEPEEGTLGAKQWSEPKFDDKIPPEAEVAKVMTIQNRWNQNLLKRAGVTGVATSYNKDGKAIVLVYTERAMIKNELPSTVEGIPVEAKVAGRFRLNQEPNDKRGNGGRPNNRTGQPNNPPESRGDPFCTTDPREQQAFPLPLGISLAHINVTAGSLACRVIDEDGNLYGLSNNHVLANENLAVIGDAIQHPGPFDAGGVDPLLTIGTLKAFVPYNLLGDNVVDAALVAVADGVLGDTTPCYGYGRVREDVVEPRLGMKVQKTGRTTWTTTGQITALNATVPVGATSGIVVFTEQVIINSEIAPGSLGGDSGSLFVTNPGRQPVALLFAGNGAGETIANPISVVLDELSDVIGSQLTIDAD